VSLGVVWAWRRLGVILDGKNRVLPVLDAFDGPIVEVKVGDLKRLRAGTPLVSPRTANP